LLCQHSLHRTVRPIQVCRVIHLFQCLTFRFTQSRPYEGGDRCGMECERARDTNCAERPGANTLAAPIGRRPRHVMRSKIRLKTTSTLIWSSTYSVGRSPLYI